MTKKVEQTKETLTVTRSGRVYSYAIISNIPRCLRAISVSRTPFKDKFLHQLDRYCEAKDSFLILNPTSSTLFMYIIEESLRKKILNLQKEGFVK